MSDEGFDAPPATPVPPAEPPSTPASRVPPPWERDLPILQRFFDTARGVLLEPTQFFRSMSRDGGLAAPLAYALVGVLVGTVGSVLSQMLMPFAWAWGVYGETVATTLVVVPMVSVVGLFVGSAILHGLLLLVASTKQPFETTFRTIAYTAGSTSLLNIIPFFGGMIGSIWAVVDLIIGLSDTHDVSQGQAAVVVLLPAVLCCGIGLLFGAAVLALIAGAVATGLS